MDRKQANVYLAVILETVCESPHGAPSGYLYAALMGKGVSLDEYNGLLGALKDRGLVNVAGSHLVTITDAGKAVVAQIKALCQDAQVSQA
jgi:hypothetical protein